MERAEPLSFAAGRFFHRDRQRLWFRAAQHGLFAVAPLLVSLLILRRAIQAHAFGIDFVHNSWMTGHRLLVGGPIYAAPGSPVVHQGFAFVYPAAAAVLSVPFGLLPRVPATVLFTVISAGAVVVTLRLLDVGDWRVYGIAFLWPPVTSGLQTANLTLVIGLGLAAAWRARDHPIAVGAAIGLLVSIKLFVWPVAFWLLATRRYRAFVWTLLWGVVINLAAWSIVGFDQIPRFAAVLRANTHDLRQDGYSVMHLLGGRTGAPGLGFGFAIAAGLMAIAWFAGHRNQDIPAFGLGIAASLAASPLIWLHSFALLIVPLALVRRQLSPWWMLPVLLWFPITQPRLWQAIIAWAVTAAITMLAVRDPASRRSIQR